MGIAAATNAGPRALPRRVRRASWTTTTMLTPDALLRVAQALAADPGLDVVYSDSGQAHRATASAPTRSSSPTGRRSTRSGAMYIGHLLVVRRSLVRGGRGLRFRLRHDPGLRVHAAGLASGPTGSTTSRRSSTTGERSRAASPPEPMRRTGVTELQARAVTAHLRAARHRGEGRPARDDSPPGATAASRRRTTPAVDVVVPSRGDADGPFNPGRQANLAAGRGDGEFIAFLGEQTEAVEPDWIEQLLLYAEMPGVVSGRADDHPPRRAGGRSRLRDRPL